MEYWLPVVGYEGLYEVSDLGRVRSPRKVLLPHVGRNGYLTVGLSKQGWQRTLRVHRLVLEAFVGPCPQGMECLHHPDPDKANNSLGNLRWGTRAENMEHQQADGSHYNTEKTHCLRGHELTPDNLVPHPYARQCKACHRMHTREWWRRNRGKALTPEPAP